MLSESITDGHTRGVSHWERNFGLASSVVTRVLPEAELLVEVQVEHLSEFLNVSGLVSREDCRIGSRFVGQPSPTEVVNDFESGATIEIFLAEFTDRFDRQRLTCQEVASVHVVLRCLDITLLELEVTRVDDEGHDVGVNSSAQG